MPITTKLISNRGVLDNYSVELSSDSSELKFSGMTITNADDVVRNKDYTITVTISDNRINKRFSDKVINVTFRLFGNTTNNNGYYKVYNLHTGFDGKLWKDTSGGTVLAEGLPYIDSEGEEKTYNIGMAKMSEYVDEKSIINFKLPEHSLTEHKIYVKINEIDYATTRLYFGVDPTAPVILATNKDSLAKNKDGVICANDSITITGAASDKEGYLYKAFLYVDGIEKQSVDFVASEDGTHTFSFTLDKNAYAGLNENVTVKVFDISKNESEAVEFGDIMFETTPASADISLVASNSVVVYNANDKKYISDDVSINVKVTDNTASISKEPVSGVASYKVLVNGVEVTDLDITATEYGDDFVINTKGYTPYDDGRLVVEVNDIYDVAGNKGVDKSFTIYVDKDVPTATFANISTAGHINNTVYGNFYNQDTVFTFDVSDNLTGIKSAYLTIGNKQLVGIVSNGTVSFKVPVSSAGNMTLILKDNVDHEVPVPINTIKNTDGINPFSSGYVLVENNPATAKCVVSRNADKGNWYKSDVSYDITIEDKSSTDISGLASVKIYVNDKEYSAKTYVDNTSLTDKVNVTINKQWIEEVINNNGSYTVKVALVDNAGNESVYKDTVYIDTVAPVISDLTGVVDGSVNTGTVTVNVEVDEKYYKEAGNNTVVTVTRTLDGQTESYEATDFVMNRKVTEKPYTFTEDGDYIVTVASEDAAGNVAVAKTIAFKIDNTAPLADITGVTENAYYLDKADAAISIVESNYEDMNVVISITRELNGVVKTIDNVVFDKTQKNSILTQTFTEEGRYTIKVDAVDAAGNVAITRTVIFTVDASAPLISISGIENGVAYKDDVIPVITINDNYYKDYSVRLVKNGVYFTEDMSGVISDVSVDMTELLMKDFDSIDNGVTGNFDTFEKVQSNDGIYTLTVSATDNAGRTSSQTVQFSVNRFGSVYTFDDNLKNIIGTYNTAIDTDFKITEYNADRLVADSVNIRITRDGSPLDEVIVDKSAMGTNNATGESGWYQYEYVISQDNFKYDGVYVITVSSADEAGNTSENLIYDALNIRFSVDTTKPELVKITGLSEDMYNAESIKVDYEVFDAIGVEEVKVYLNGNCIQDVTEFTDITTYAGTFAIGESSDGQHVRFEVRDIAGNVIDSDNTEDVMLGKITTFNNDVTISTDALVRWYANKPLFYGSLIATGTIVAGGSSALVFRIRKLRTFKNK